MAMPYAAEEARERRDMMIAAALTVLYFLLVSFFWFSSEAITRLRKTDDAPQVRQITSLKRLPPVAPPQAAVPPESRFVDASGLQESKDVDPRTALQSDRNTAAASKVITGTDPTLGGQEGKKDDSLNMRDTRFSPNQASPPPSAPSARLSPNPPQPATKPPPAPSPALPKPQDQVKPIAGPGTPIQKASADTPPDTKPDQAQDTTPPTPSAAQAAADASDSSSAMAPPPDIFRDRSAVAGGAQLGQDASFASMATALGRYQHKLYLAIGSRWNLRIQQTMAQIGVDRVVIRFHVNPDGSISDLDVIQGNPNSMLSVVSADSIQQSSNLIGPFPDDLKKDKPNGFPWQLAFRIY